MIIMHFLYPQILHNHCFLFLLAITVVPIEILNKVHLGLGENGEKGFCRTLNQTVSKVDLILKELWHEDIPLLGQF